MLIIEHFHFHWTRFIIEFLLENMIKKENHPKCEKSNRYLYHKMQTSIELANMLIESFDDTLQNGTKLQERFYRDFETEKNYHK